MADLQVQCDCHPTQGGRHAVDCAVSNYLRAKLSAEAHYPIKDKT